MGWALIQYAWGPYKKTLGHRQKPKEDQLKMQGRTDKEEKKKTNPTDILSCMSSLQNCQKINFCCLKQLVYGALLWWPEQTDTSIAGEARMESYLNHCKSLSITCIQKATSEVFLWHYSDIQFSTIHLMVLIPIENLCFNHYF